MFKCEECGSSEFSILTVDRRNEIMHLECKVCGAEVDLEDYTDPFVDFLGLDVLLESYEHRISMVDDYALTM